MFDLRAVRTKSDWNDFLDVVYPIYRDDPYFVPPLRIAVKEVLDVNKNPFFKHAYMNPIVAYRDGIPVGRIVGVIDENHNKTYQEQTAFFGFFECIQDQSLANQLLDAVSSWAKEWAMKTVRGPMNPSTNGEFGLLVDGFEDPPCVMTTYNPPYYLELIEGYGFSKSMDTFAYEISAQGKFGDRLIRHVERLKKRRAITIRPINTKKFDEEVEQIFAIYSEAWEKNWGFVRMERDEVQALIKELKMIYDPRMVLIAEVHGEMAGFGIGLPDVNQALIRVKDGRLTLGSIAKLLWFIKGPGRKKCNRVRIYGLGFKKKFESLGLGPIMYMEYLKLGKYYGRGEASWILENNIPMNRALHDMGAKKTKTWRVFDRPIQVQEQRK